MNGPVDLGAALLAGGVDHVAWWNGRILTAEDLRDLQQAVATSDRRLGRAVGDGVAAGLMVSARADRTSVTVTPGVAVDPAGEVLALVDPDPLVVSVVATSSPASADGSVFVACRDAPAVRSASGLGVYLLTIGSASGTRGSAPGTGGEDGRAVACGPRYEVAGIRFRVVEVDLPGLATTLGHDETDLAVLRSASTSAPDDRLRNVAAHMFLDSLPRLSSVADVLSPTAARPSAVEVLRGGGQLTDCEVPLALLGWGPTGLSFVDCWAVRRPRRPRPDVGVGASVGDRAIDLGLASLQQFTTHLADLAAAVAGGLGNVRGDRWLRYLPPVVLLPAGGGGAGISDVFLQGLDRSIGAEVPARRVWPLLRASLTGPPIDLERDPTVVTHEVPDAGAREALLLAADPLVPPPPEGEAVFELQVTQWNVNGRLLAPLEPIQVSKVADVTLQVETNRPATLTFAAVLQQPFARLTLQVLDTVATVAGDGGQATFRLRIALSGGFGFFGMAEGTLKVSVTALSPGGQVLGSTSGRRDVRVAL